MTAGRVTGRGGAGKTRVKTARRRSAQSTRWLQRQLDDPYVKAAKARGYRSRAAFKLLELDERHGLLAGRHRIVDLGAAPGGWTQVVRERRPQAAVVAIDLLDMDAVDGATALKMDFMDDAAPDALLAELGGAPDLILSDMAANTIGHRQTDHLRTMALVEAAADFAFRTLETGGAFVAKVLAGGADDALVAQLRREFTKVKHVKPPASRKDSSEWYVVATGRKPLAPEPDESGEV
ncbi:MAG: RlmE family RNA methyltransferase [Pseudomonadota bacterium]